ncbi:DUF2460 domain-containing protein [Phyllobacterium leguminum]|uniref:Uncharacterized protein (TIGR02217 family) n=1 Tax=Phyllobacterium leguminum TaxID=314237 RepID=A0A318T467_9HYPH|nr:DUF2460 domain-containing protein [Phyllobacterium leguminum]PYE86918.1 uncharacterized protein (TIGR02217 family) [Phyllobacterium leguminum]
MAFHEVRFPTDISRGAQGGPKRKTTVVSLASGFEQRNSQWADSKRAYNAGYGLRSIDDIHAVITFFEERRGRLHGFRWKDFADFKSTSPGKAISATDQRLGTGDGAKKEFQLIKTYGSAFLPWIREIRKPVSGTVVVAVSGTVQNPGTAYTIDETTGVVTFAAAPAKNALITAGYEFDVPVRFDTDELLVTLDMLVAGDIPDIPIVEIRL